MTDTRATNALLACPFCGRTDLLGFEPTGEGGFLAVKCRACGTHGPAKLSTDELEAAAHWNRRAAHEPRANTEGEVGLAADVGPGGGASASAPGETHAPELSPAPPPPVVQDMEKIAWCQKVHEDLAVYVDDGGGQMIHVRAKRALGIMFEEMQKLEKALYPSLTKSGVPGSQPIGEYMAELRKDPEWKDELAPPADPGPLDSIRWICPKCATVNGVEDSACLGCRKPRAARETSELHPMDPREWVKRD